MSALYQFSKIPKKDRPDIVCYEKQAVWCGQWNVTWQTGIFHFVGFSDFNQHLIIYTIPTYFTTWQTSDNPVHIRASIFRQL